MLQYDKSYLFVPGDNEKYINKALITKADVIILDLEDAVAKNKKEEARETIRKVIGNNRKIENKFIIRINDLSTDFWIEDLKLAQIVGAYGIMVPKTESKDQIELLVMKINELNTNKIEIFPLIETAKGLLNSFEIATAHKLVSRIAFGSVDFTLDIGAELSQDGKELLFARSMLVTVSKAAGIASPIDSPYIEIFDKQGFINEVKLSKQLGFKSKLLIHPKQIDLLHEIYLPTKEEFEKAEILVKEFEKALEQKQAAISHNGRMIDYPVYKKAKLILEQYSSANLDSF